VFSQHDIDGKRLILRLVGDQRFVVRPGTNRAIGSGIGVSVRPSERIRESGVVNRLDAMVEGKHPFER